LVGHPLGLAGVVAFAGSVLVIASVSRHAFI
jgi:hypothetical protein